MNQKIDATKIAFIHISVNQTLVNVYWAAIGANIGIWQLIDVSCALLNARHAYPN